MHVGKKSPSELLVRNISAQAGVSRLAWSGDAVLTWKGNLTALSQSESLYFIALNDRVYVDRPSYPEQKLSTNDDVHDLRWRLPKSGLQASHGFHNGRYPHGINRLEIGELGSMEALICVCDDGDVLTYAVLDIKAAFIAIENGLPQSIAVEKYIKPKDIYNVGISAWGVAMQREVQEPILLSMARLLAISSNDHNIHMKALALDSCDSDGRNITAHLPTIFLPRSTQKLDRSTEVRWSLRGHQANIPSVAFYLSESSDANVYLISSDIDCNIIFWNVSEGSQIIHKFSSPTFDASLQYGWITLPISPNSFRLNEATRCLNGFAEDLNCSEEAMHIFEGEKIIPSSLPCPIVHTRSYQVSLISGQNPNTTTNFMSPWREHNRGAPFEGIHMDFGTLKYARQIQELGIVVAASDAGYVGIFTLTRFYKGDLDVHELEKVGMRLDCILPFDNQIPLWIRQVHGVNLWSGIVGIATAPMQGFSKGKFRLILEFGDRTILCYELSRNSQNQG